MHPTPVLLIITLFIAGCGHKAPLYLPDQKPVNVKRGTRPATTPDTPNTPAPSAETPARP